MKAVDSATQNSQLKTIKALWQRYGVQRSPFSTHINFDSFFPTEHWAIQYQDFKTFLDLPAKPFLIISGKQGTGRYSLLEQFINRCDFQGKNLRFTAQIDISFDSICQAIEESWLATDYKKKDHETYLLDKLLQNIDERHSHLLIFNNADKIPLHVLARLLTPLMNSPQQYQHVKMIFIANNEFLERLQTLMIKPNSQLTQHIAVKALTETETENYLRHRLHTAGIDPRYTLRRSAISQLFKRSGGKTAIINNLIKQYMPSDLFEKPATNNKSSASTSKTPIYQKAFRTINNTLIYKGILSLGLFSLGYMFFHYQADFKFGRFILAQKYGGMKIPHEHLLNAHRSADKVFQSNSGYSLISADENNSIEENSSMENFSTISHNTISSEDGDDNNNSANDYSTLHDSSNFTQSKGITNISHAYASDDYSDNL